MRFSEYFWDFDGTLYDTYPRIIRAVRKALADCGVSVDCATLAPLVKVVVNRAFDVFLPGREAEGLARYRVHAEEEGPESMPLYPGTREMLQSVVDHGGRNYLYTHRGKTALEALERDGLTALFTDFVTRENGFPPKPAPDALQSQLAKHRLDPARCVMVGDRDIDLESGISAGMNAVLFDPDGFYRNYETPLRFASMIDMQMELIRAEDVPDLKISDMKLLQAELNRTHPNWPRQIPEAGKGQMLWMLGEAGEVIDILKKNSSASIAQPGFVRSRFIEEMADIEMYFFDVLNCYGVTPEEFSRIFYEKYRHNQVRDWNTEIKERYGK